MSLIYTPAAAQIRKIEKEKHLQKQNSMTTSSMNQESLAKIKLCKLDKAGSDPIL
jgi:hypothetical protein